MNSETDTGTCPECGEEIFRAKYDDTPESFVLHHAVVPEWATVVVSGIPCWMGCCGMEKECVNDDGRPIDPLPEEEKMFEMLKKKISMLAPLEGGHTIVRMRWDGGWSVVVHLRYPDDRTPDSDFQDDLLQLAEMRAMDRGKGRTVETCLMNALKGHGEWAAKMGTLYDVGNDYLTNHLVRQRRRMTMNAVKAWVGDAAWDVESEAEFVEAIASLKLTCAYANEEVKEQERAKVRELLKKWDPDWK